MSAEFFEAAKYLAGAKPPLKILNQIFHYEKLWRDSNGPERQKKRTELIKPLLRQFWELVENCVTTPKSLLGRAITYARGRKEAINKLMQYGNLDISNNICKQAAKPLVIDRKIFCLVPVWLAQKRPPCG